jgi:hypothetical protein
MPKIQGYTTDWLVLIALVVASVFFAVMAVL